MVIVVTGVSGVGKTTAGQRLALELGWPFHDADDLHPLANVDRMRGGQPLTEADRRPWLEMLATLIADHVEAGRSMVLACSALRRSHRDLLLERTPDRTQVRLVHLHADHVLLKDRIEQRTGHFFPATLLESQLSALEAPTPDEEPYAITLDATLTPDEIVTAVRAELDV
jgi:gluconokinase